MENLAKFWGLCYKNEKKTYFSNLYTKFNNLNKAVGPGKNPKLINVWPTFIPGSRVSFKWQTRDKNRQKFANIIKVWPLYKLLVEKLIGHKVVLHQREGFFHVIFANYNRYRSLFLHTLLTTFNSHNHPCHWSQDNK